MQIRETGIWQGRFQYIHSGHAHVFKTELSKFKNKMIAIVNPNPLNPAKNFDRFGVNQNPFTYFQRMLLWKTLADHEKCDVTIIPCWHARYIIALENDFLPSRSNRSWIVPVSQDDREEDKSRDLREKGEDVFDADFMSEPVEFRSVSATMIRRCLESNNLAYRQFIPEPICELTEKLVLGIDENIYYAIPFIDDKIDLYSLQYALNIIKEEAENTYLLFTVSVHVSAGELSWKNSQELPWWFKNVEPGFKTYYKKAQLLNKLMKKINIKNYLIVPIFVMKKNFNYLREYNYAFLPNIDKCKWIINKNAKELYKNDFIMYLDNIEADDNILYLQDEKNIQVSNLISSFFRSNDIYVYKHKLEKNNSKTVEKKVLQRWVDHLFDQKIGEIETRISAGYDKVDEIRRQEDIEILQLWSQKTISKIFTSSNDDVSKQIKDFKNGLIQRLDKI